MRFYNSSKPFEFMQFRKTADSKVDVVLLPTFVDVVFLDEFVQVVSLPRYSPPSFGPKLERYKFHLVC